MAYFKKLIEKENAGKLTYGNYIVQEIVEIAVSEVPFVKFYNPGCAIDVYSDKDGIHIGVVVKIHYSQSVSDMAFKIQETVRHNVESMTEYHVANVNVTVKDVFFDEEVSSNIVEQSTNEAEEPEEQKD